MENKTKEIIAFTYPHEAHMAMSFLESHDIEVVLKDELTVQVHNFLSNAIGGVKLFVEESSADEALQLLESGGFIVKNHAETKTNEIFSKGYDFMCPYCKSDEVSKVKKPGWIFLLSILFLKFPILYFKKEYFCYDCSKTWRTK